MLATFIQQLMNGLMLGGNYALVAIGYTLIFVVLNLLHLAHGEVAMIGSDVGLTLVLTAMSQFAVLPIWMVLIGAMLGAGLVGIVVELVVFRPLGRRQLHITPLITTIAVAFILQEAAIKLFGSEQGRVFQEPGTGYVPPPASQVATKNATLASHELL